VVVATLALMFGSHARSATLVVGAG